MLIKQKFQFLPNMVYAKFDTLTVINPNKYVLMLVEGK